MGSPFPCPSALSFCACFLSLSLALISTSLSLHHSLCLLGAGSLLLLHPSLSLSLSLPASPTPSPNSPSFLSLLTMSLSLSFYPIRTLPFLSNVSPVFLLCLRPRHFPPFLSFSVYSQHALQPAVLEATALSDVLALCPPAHPLSPWPRSVGGRHECRFSSLCWGLML